jgi:hypothetical protein
VREVPAVCWGWLVNSGWTKALKRWERPPDPATPLKLRTSRWRCQTCGQETEAVHDKRFGAKVGAAFHLPGCSALKQGNPWDVVVGDGT